MRFVLFPGLKKNKKNQYSYLYILNKSNIDENMKMMCNNTPVGWKQGQDGTLKKPSNLEGRKSKDN